VLDTSYAEEAGIKSTTFEIGAPYAFGTLSVEAGTHRLVRMSPFNSAEQSDRPPSQPWSVVPLVEQTESIDIPTTTCASTSSAPAARRPVGQHDRLRRSHHHLPTGIVVSCQNEKSQIQNRAAALRVLQSRLLLLQREQKRHEEGIRRATSRQAGATRCAATSWRRTRWSRTSALTTRSTTPATSSTATSTDFIAAGIRWRKQAPQD
jgi:peptide chain release factor 2